MYVGSLRQHSRLHGRREAPRIDNGVLLLWLLTNYRQDGTHSVHHRGRRLLHVYRFLSPFVFPSSRFCVSVLSYRRDDCVIWNGIHMKTAMNGGEPNYGYPDPTYFTRVKAVGVCLARISCRRLWSVRPCS